MGSQPPNRRCAWCGRTVQPAGGASLPESVRTGMCTACLAERLESLVAAKPGAGVHRPSRRRRRGRGGA
jgi:hypothetical protein